MTEVELAAVVKALAPIVRTAVDAAVVDVVERVKALDARPVPRDGVDGAPGAKGERGDPGPQGLVGERGPEGPVGTIGRDGLPGVPGANGLRGEKGLSGERGTDGVNGRDGTLENLQIAYDGERTVTFAFKNGDPVDGGVLRLPIPIYRDTWTEGKQYDAADVVTWGGSMWFCRQPTNSKPIEGTKAWTICAKRGRDGKDGRDAALPLPVVRA